MDAAMGVPPGRLTVAAVRRRLVRRRIREAAGVLAVAVVAVTGGTAAVRIYSAAPRPAAPHRAGPTVYAAYDNASHCASCNAVVPVDTATKTAGKPIRVGFGPAATTLQIAVSPDGKTAYALEPDSFRVIPIDTATGTAGKPIRVPRTRIDAPSSMAISPDGKTLYVANTGQHAVVPISTATGTAGKAIPVGSGPQQIAITPDGRTAYAVNYGTSGIGRGTVTPVNTATGTASKPIRVGIGAFAILITPDGTTAYAYSGGTLTPISTATNTAGKTINLHANFGEGGITITPDGKTIYALTINPDRVVPISVATGTPGTPIDVKLSPYGIPFNAAAAATQFVLSPDGKTIYLGTGGDAVIPISTVTNTAGKTISFGSDCRSQPREHPHISIAFTPDGKTAYVACESAVIPISTATGAVGKPIRVPLRDPDTIAIKP